MNRKGHGPIDYISKGFGVVLGIAFMRLASDGIAMSSTMAFFLGLVLVLISIAAFFG